jgi:NTE family protein
MTRALVLGGGGPVGIGWESGLAVGLRQGGVDLTTADAIYGTSAGAFVGAQLALGLDIAETAALLLETSATAVASTAPSITEGLQALSDFLTDAVQAGTPAEEVRRALGPLALEADVVDEGDFVDLFAVLKGHPWPERFFCTAVDTATAEFVVWELGSAADLQHAVASSCAVPMVCPPVTIAGRRYMDGGVRSPLNADLAKGNDAVLVVSVTTLSTPAPPASSASTGPAVSDGPVSDGPGSDGPGSDGPGSDGSGAGPLVPAIADEFSALSSSGAAVMTIEPNGEFLELSRWGSSLMDVGKAGEAFLMGLRQGLEESDRISSLWAR